MAAGRGGRRVSGALCPTVSMVPGACADNLGGTSCVSPFGRLLFSHALPRLQPTYQETDMVVRKEKKIAVEPLRVKNPHAAGIDVHAEVHWVAVPPGSAPVPPKDHPANLPPWVRAFGT